MTLQGVRLTVGRTWRWAVGDRVCTELDLTAYRALLDGLKSRGTRGGAGGFGLPWPPYASRLWAYQYGPTYQDVRTPVQVATLLPTLWTADRPSGPRVEALRHPFAVTTLTHVDLDDRRPWPEDPAEASARLRSALDAALGAGRVRDGAALDLLPGLPDQDFEGRSLTRVGAGRFVLLSALHGEPDGLATASALALRFDDDPVPDAAFPVRSRRGAVCVDGETVGLTLPGDLPRAAQRLDCLHHNDALLLAWVQNLASLLAAPATVSAGWYVTRSAELLSHVVRREPLPETGTVYRARLPELWLRARRLTGAVDALAPGLPPIGA